MVVVVVESREVASTSIVAHALDTRAGDRETDRLSPPSPSALVIPVLGPWKTGTETCRSRSTARYVPWGEREPLQVG